jgi:hypothetical protein
MVKLGVILLVKLSSPYWCQRMTIGAFALCAIRLVKLTPGLENSEEACVQSVQLFLSMMKKER